MLRIDGLTYRIAGRTILDGASAMIPDGHRVGLVGHNGAGKSTLFRLMLGEAQADDGEAVIDRGARIGTVAQEAPGADETPIDVVLAGDKERAQLMAAAETETDPHRVAEIHERLTAIGAHSGPARAQAVLRILRGGQSESQDSAEMAAIVSSGGSVPAFSAEESTMIERVLTLGERQVRTIMVPRVEVIWLNAEDDSATILGEIRASGRSRFPVCRGTVDEVVGVVHAKDLLAQAETLGRLVLMAAMRKPLYVIEGMPILKMLEQFKSSAIHMAIVVDEHGTFEGIVTPTDILVAIAGDLPEIAGEEIPYASKQDDGTWHLEGRMPVEEAEQALQVTGMLGENDDFLTLAGFLLARFGRLPVAGDEVEWRNWRFKVEALDGHRIDRVIATRIDG